MRARPATPPTTPPTMAPVWFEELEDEDPEESPGRVAVGDVVTTPSELVTVT